MAHFLKKSMILFLIPFSLFSKDFGTKGYLFEIEEEDFQKYIQNKLTSFSAEKEEEIKAKFIEKIKTPEPVSGLTKAFEYKYFYFDPTITVKEDIVDHQGTIISKKGTVINPLDTVALTEELLFFDATDEEQLNWAKTHSPLSKWILVKGSPIKLEKELKKSVYFDQFGLLKKKLGFESIPTKVSQEGRLLKIEEIPVSGGKF